MKPTSRLGEAEYYLPGCSANAAGARRVSWEEGWAFRYREFFPCYDPVDDFPENFSRLVIPSGSELCLRKSAATGRIGPARYARTAGMSLRPAGRTTSMRVLPVRSRLSSADDAVTFL